MRNNTDLSSENDIPACFEKHFSHFTVLNHKGSNNCLPIVFASVFQWRHSGNFSKYALNAYLIPDKFFSGSNILALSIYSLS